MISVLEINVIRSVVDEGEELLIADVAHGAAPHALGPVAAGPAPRGGFELGDARAQVCVLGLELRESRVFDTCPLDVAVARRPRLAPFVWPVHHRKSLLVIAPRVVPPRARRRYDGDVETSTFVKTSCSRERGSRGAATSRTSDERCERGAATDGQSTLASWALPRRGALSRRPLKLACSAHERCRSPGWRGWQSSRSSSSVTSVRATAGLTPVRMTRAPSRRAARAAFTRALAVWTSTSRTPVMSRIAVWTRCSLMP